MGLCVACLACTSEAPPTLLQRTPRDIGNVLAAARHHMARKTTSFCAGEIGPNASWALALNTELCLRCRDVGWALRKLRADSAHELILLVPIHDTTAVCDYLRREHVRMPIIGLNSGLFLSMAFRDSLVAISLGRDAPPRLPIIAYDGVHLVGSLAASDRSERKPVVTRSTQTRGAQ